MEILLIIFGAIFLTAFTIYVISNLVIALLINTIRRIIDLFRC